MHYHWATPRGRRHMPTLLFYFAWQHCAWCICESVCVCVCVRARLHVCGWLCTLYDKLTWLHEQPSLTTSTPDLVVWVCVQGICCRGIFMLYCMHSHRGVIVLILATWATLVSPCMWRASTCLMLWRDLTRLGTSMSIHAVYTDMKPYQCTIMH